MERIIKEILENNGNGFSTKEILQAHIRDNKEEHKLFFKRLSQGDRNLASRKFVWQMAGVLFLLIGSLTSYVVVYG